MKRERDGRMRRGEGAERDRRMRRGENGEGKQRERERVRVIKCLPGLNKGDPSDCELRLLNLSLPV